MWSDLTLPWQEAFTMAWEAYCKNTIPIGCVITDDQGKIITKSRNMIFDMLHDHEFTGSKMGHAEMTALFNISKEAHPDIRKYHLYSTMEPCPMCFGTIVMMNIRNVSFAARDSWAGATEINGLSTYINKKDIKVSRGSKEMEFFQLVIQSVYELERTEGEYHKVLEKWRELNPSALLYAQKVYQNKYLIEARATCKDISVIYNDIIKNLVSS